MIQLDDWQKEVLDYDGDILLCTGRRVGKTYIFCEKAVRRMMVKKTTIVLCSITEDQAIFIIDTMKRIAQELCPSQIGKGKIKPTLTTLTFKNGSKAFSRPAGQTGDSLRGFEADILYVDEASRMQPLFWLAAKPLVLTTKGQIWLSSTPFGKKGYFWERFDEAYNKKEPEARFKVIYKSTIEVIEERPLSNSWTPEQREQALKIIEQDRKELSKLAFGQEYMGLFLEDLQQYFPNDLINSCCILKRPDKPILNNNFSGHDIARLGGDETTHEIIHMAGKNYFIQYENINKKSQLTTRTEEDIIYLQKIWNIDKIGIDAGSGSLGVGVYDRLLEHPILKRKVVPMNNRDISLDRDGKKKQRIFKEDMYDNLKSMMERGELKLLDDDSIKTSLASIQIEFSEEDEVSKVKIWGAYSHIAEGLIRAAWLARKEKINKVWIAYI